MKRLTAALLAVLWTRQIRFERRMARRQGWWEREADRGMKGHGEEVAKGFKEIDGVLRRWHREIEKAFSRASGGARR